MATFTWKANIDSPLPTGYLLEKSIDNGLSWTTVTTVAHVIPGPDYDTDTEVFSYVDPGSVPGEIVRIQAVDSGDASRNSSYRFNTANPAAPQTVHLYGSVIDATTGEARPGVEVRLCPIPEASSSFVPTEGSSTSVPGILPQTLMGMKREVKVFTDDAGAWSVDVLRDLPVHLDIPAVRFSLRFRTPKDRDILNVTDAPIYRISGSRGAEVPYEYGVGSGFVT